MKQSFLVRKIIVIIIGAIISAFGISLAIGAGFGGATLAVLWQGVANVCHISIGAASAVVAVVMILFSLCYDRKQIHIGTFIYQIFYSGFVEIFSRYFHNTDSTAVNIIIMLAGIVIFAFGTGLYASSDLGRGSYESVTFAIARKNNFQVKYVRIILDLAVVTIGVLLGGKFGLCTVVTIILSGPVIQFTKNNADKILFSK